MRARPWAGGELRLSLPTGAPTAPPTPKNCIGGVTEERRNGPCVRQSKGPACTKSTLGSFTKQLLAVGTGWTLSPVGPTAVTRNLPPELTNLCPVVVATSW